MKALPSPLMLQTPTGQLSMPFDMPELRGMSPKERSLAVARLATLLMAATGVAIEETRDDEQ